MKVRAYWCSRPFVDSKKFPYGFSRSGIFTLAESQLLETKGHLLKALMDEKVFDPSEEDLAFCKAIRSGNYHFNTDTKVWFKYLSHQRRLISISGGWINTGKDDAIIDVDEVEISIDETEDWDFDSERDDLLEAS